MVWYEFCNGRWMLISPAHMLEVRWGIGLAKVKEAKLVAV